MGLLRAAAIAIVVLPLACTSVVEGEKEGPQIKTFDIAVGATVTLVLGDPRCQTSPPPGYGCLSGRRVDKVENAEVVGNGALTVVRQRVDDIRDRILVDVRADGPGDGMLRVDYSDRFDGVKRDEFIVRALPITHVDEHVGCQFNKEVPESHRYPVSRGSKVGVALVAMNEATPLLSGALELVADRGGLDPNVVVDDQEGGVSRTVQADRLGAFTWKLVGARQKELTFDVYDPETVGVLVTPANDGAVTVRTAVNGVPTCFYAGTGRAMTRVSDGACKLLVGDYEVEGELPVSLARGGETFVVEGSARCTVESRVASGPPGSATVDAHPITELAVPTGDAVGTTPLERGGTLPKREACLRVKSISNGKCEAINAGGYFVLPDGDCIIDFDWFADPYEDDKPNTSPVGVGLLTELRIGLRLQLFGLLTLKPLVPNALAFAPTALEVQRLGCDNGSNYEALALRPPSAGHHGIRFTADNAPEPLDYDVEARNVARVDYTRDKLDTRESGSVKTSLHFLRADVPLKLAYFDSGGQKLRGVGPLRVSTTDPAARVVLRGSEVFTGTAPNRITLASPASQATHAIDVVDATAVASVGGIAPKVGASSTVCVTPFPQAASGQRIYGQSPTRPRLSFAGGDACAMVGGVFAGSVIDTGRGEICASATAGRPASEIKISWGAATATWPCQPAR